MADLKDIGDYAIESMKAVAVLGVGGASFAVAVTVLKWIFTLIA